MCTQPRSLVKSSGFALCWAKFILHWRNCSANAMQLNHPGIPHALHISRPAGNLQSCNCNKCCIILTSKHAHALQQNIQLLQSRCDDSSFKDCFLIHLEIELCIALSLRFTQWFQFILGSNSASFLQSCHTFQFALELDSYGHVRFEGLSNNYVICFDSS